MTSNIEEIDVETYEDPPPSKGSTAEVYRPADGTDYSNGGLSGRVTQVTIIGVVDTTRDGYPTGGKRATIRPLPPHARVFAPTEQAPPVVLVIRHIGRRIVHLAPAGDGVLWRWMFGGALVDSADSRLRELVGFYGGVRLHDRTEFER
jgi:hypothetical protein